MLKRFVFRLLLIVTATFVCGLIGSKMLTQTIHVESSELTLNNFPTGTETDLSFSIQNPSFFGVIEIVGIHGSCGQGCVEEAGVQPFQLEPRQSKRLTVKFKSPQQPGPIDAEFFLYFTSFSRTRIQRVVVCGNAIENNNR